MRQETEDEAAIRKIVEIWHRATTESDVATVLRLIAEDAVFLAPERPPDPRTRQLCAAPDRSS